MHGRDGTSQDLCDVCFWRARYDYVIDKLCNRIADLEIDAKAAERLAKITPDTKLLTHDEVFCKIK